MRSPPTRTVTSWRHSAYSPITFLVKCDESNMQVNLGQWKAGAEEPQNFIVVLDLDDLPEQAFLNVGDADSARAKARELEANA